MSLKYDEVPTTEIVVNDVDIDEGIAECVIIDITDQAHGLASGPLLPKKGSPNGALTTDIYKDSKDSGFSSRVSEVDGVETDERKRRMLLTDQKALATRLTRISECQNDDSCHCQPKQVALVILKTLAVVALLYLFICTLDLLSNAFRLLGGKTAGSVFQDSALLANPITGLMIGVLATVILQSSSTSSSIVITMVASKIIDLHPAIPIIMGANIGTTVTNTLVSLAHSMDRKEFRRAFSGAVVHDVFNWLTVLILLPLEHFTGYLYYLTGAIVNSLDIHNSSAKDQDLLKKITKPLTSKIVQIDEHVITAIAEGKQEFANQSVLKINCKLPRVQQYVLVNESIVDNVTGDVSWNVFNRSVIVTPTETCNTLFNLIGWSDTSSGILLFFVSIVALSLCLYLMVKVLHSLLGGQIAKAARKTINADFPKPFHWLTGYFAIIVGAGMTILVQSSSVFTSALTPLVGIGCLKIERMYPLTLGSNIGTTFTGILAALASSPDTLSTALQLAFCHLFFNISGILLFYPVPFMRRIVLNTAKKLGRTTAHYRWFAIAYLVFMFLVLPGIFFLLSFAGSIVFIVFVSIIAFIAFGVVVINVMQRYAALKRWLPLWLHNWKFLPEVMRSLAPIDRCLQKVVEPLRNCCCECCTKRCTCLAVSDIDNGYIDSDSEIDSSAYSSYLPSAASSRIWNSQSGADLRHSDSSRRIYKPKEFSSRRNSLNKKSSPLLNRVEEEAPSTNLLPLPPTTHHHPNFYISKSDLNLKAQDCDEKDASVQSSELTGQDDSSVKFLTNLVTLNESKI
ncbi:sodium-dependent phosphate transport protein 2A-like [Biomphalaria glabrata]|uniref:Sodium-dependent phosphate transport protein 2A-like n=1 Tax=Biomphalaria glabrata TaxID=6526 RepID=A0A9U8DTR7_BIOGL|nr:sodium-dependent phosphate transport protein 2A-like [Biomphalaria glabrata]